MKNKKGFTLIEILVAIVLVLSISALAIVAYNNTNKINKEDQYNMIVEEIKAASENYITKNGYLFDNVENGFAIIPLRTLVNDNYLGILVDPRDKKKLDKCSYTKAEISNGNYDISYVNDVNDRRCDIGNYLIYNSIQYNDSGIYEVDSHDIHVVLENGTSYTPGNVVNKVGNWYNIESFSSKDSYMDSSTGESAIYYCINFKVGTSPDNKQYLIVNDQVDFEIEGLTSYSDKYIENDESNGINRVCKIFIKDFDYNSKNINVIAGGLNISYGENIGKDTVAPKITPDSDNKIISGDPILSSISSKWQYKNRLQYKSIITDNIKLDKSSFITDFPNPNYLSHSYSDDDKKDTLTHISIANNNNDVSDYLTRDPFDSSKYIFLFDIGIKDEAGNPAEYSDEYLGYIPCQDSNSRHKLGSYSLSFLGSTYFHEGNGLHIPLLGCYGTRRLHYYENSYYDTNLGLNNLTKSNWKDFEKKGIDQLFNYAVCSVDRRFEMKDDGLCTLYIVVGKTIICEIANKDCSTSSFPGFCELTKNVAQTLCGRSRVSERIDVGHASVVVSLLDGNKVLWTKQYKPSSSTQRTNLNDESRYPWFNGIDFSKGLKLQVMVNGITSYQWNLPDADTGKGETRTDESHVETEATYTIKKDGKNRTATISAGNGTENINVELTFNVDLTPPEINFTSGPSKKSCSGALGVSTNWNVIDTTSGPNIAKYYYGNGTDFDTTIKVPHRSGNGSTITYTDNWSSKCTQNNIPSSGVCYYQKILATDIAGNIAKKNSPSCSTIGR